MSVKFNPYISFNGNCEQAFCFYKTVFGGEFSKLTRHGEMFKQHDVSAFPEEIGHQIRYIELPIGDNLTLIGTDNTKISSEECLCEGNNVKICIMYRDKEEAKRVFDALSVGATIKNPFSKSFLGDYYGSLIDKFKINWLIVYNIRKAQPTFEDNANFYLP